ncbi:MULTISPECIES: DCC1-like thiol-disulfide oxidoreductase family protein [unclassified Mucilaginibacter]|uniref:DCC1-like thiol-disulfide oxidoreductase family protein n=1 Tax=unclassified Mucilaginibacter TaxID=2617802 RepID=UPI000961957E|nr:MULTISPECIES: DCC1-like thiol-disulfide oxidoreductase family protein [unclassified Mucilaginibacter]OJW12755.1 MAG: DUF393 domain-containing protein [Mucilaginibacter sp. 44-25]PLW90652.1 MAG: DUF393 domain-containing protein [Mucilaginibacter sp.]PMP65414.1 MAG: DUF393 domain-containing protein [Mucilaginibacter sp.]HEK20823.1 DUF393 domain-containing protein [Bacteroidota bacterium]
MKTLGNYTILYDAECPMCNIYTKAFVKTGMLDNAGRAPYQELAPDDCPLVNRQRAAYEIALVNRQTGEVTYGIKSLFKILGNAWPAFKRLFSFTPFVWLMSKGYAFISYNRRVIIPARNESYIYQPTFKLRYRVAYLLFTWFITAFILTRYAPLLQGMVPVGGAYREYLICGGQILFQGGIISLLVKQKRWEYLVNMMTISFAGSILLLPIVLLSAAIGMHPLFYTLYFLLVAGLMFLEHIRRSKIMGIGWRLTITWAIYRVAVLGTILFI